MPWEEVVGDLDAVLLEFLSHFLLKNLDFHYLGIHLNTVYIYPSVYASRSWACIGILLDAPGSLSSSHELYLLGEQVVVHHVFTADFAPFCCRDIAGDPEVSENSYIVLQMLWHKNVIISRLKKTLSPRSPGCWHRHGPSDAVPSSLWIPHFWLNSQQQLWWTQQDLEINKRKNLKDLILIAGFNFLLYPI